MHFRVNSTDPVTDSVSQTCSNSSQASRGTAGMVLPSGPAHCTVSASNPAAYPPHAVPGSLSTAAVNPKDRNICGRQLDQQGSCTAYVSITACGKCSRMT